MIMIGMRYRLAEEVSLFEQLVKKTEGGAEDELLGVQEFRHELKD